MLQSKPLWSALEHLRNEVARPDILTVIQKAKDLGLQITLDDIRTFLLARQHFDSPVAVVSESVTDFI